MCENKLSSLFLVSDFFFFFGACFSLLIRVLRQNDVSCDDMIKQIFYEVPHCHLMVDILQHCLFL